MGSLSPLAGMMLKEISHRLGWQIIMLTHDKKLALAADVEYLVERDGEGSHVYLVRGDVEGDPIKLVGDTKPKKPRKLKKPKKPAIARIRA